MYFIYSRFQNLKKEPLTKGSDRGTEVGMFEIHSLRNWSSIESGVARFSIQSITFE